MIGAHDVQAEVDACGDPGAGENLALVDEQDLRTDTHLREALRELRGELPVRRRRATVKQPGGGQRERPHAHRCDPGPPIGRPPQRPDHGSGGFARVEPRHDHGVGGVDRAEAARHADLDPGGGQDGSGPLGTDLERVPVALDRTAEDLSGDREVEQDHIGDG